MPTTTKLNRPIRSSGSGGLNLNPSWQDEPFVDPQEELRRLYLLRQQLLNKDTTNANIIHTVPHLHR